jgi:hypothetical protein
LLDDYGGYKQKDCVLYICKVVKALEFNAAIYPTEWDWILSAKQHLIGDALSAWD